MPHFEIHGRRYEDEHAIRERVSELDAEHAGRPMPGAARAEWNSLNETIAEFDTRRERIRRLEQNTRNCQEPLGEPTVRPETSEARDGGLRTIERHAGHLRSGAADRLDTNVRADRSGVDSRYLAAVGDPAYFTAFGKMPALGR